MTRENTQEHKQLFHIDELIKMLVDFKINSGGDVFFDKCNIDIEGYDKKILELSLKSRTRKYKKGGPTKCKNVIIKINYT